LPHGLQLTRKKAMGTGTEHLSIEFGGGGGYRGHAIHNSTRNA